MKAAILNSAMLDSDTAILDSDTLLSSLRFTQKHSHSTLTLTLTNSIWLTRWWQPSWILPPHCAIFDSAILHKTLTQKFTTHSFSLNSDCQTAILDSDILLSSFNLMILTQTNSICSPSWILPCWIQTLPSWIQTPCYLLSDSLKNTLTSLWLWLKLIQSDS